MATIHEDELLREAGFKILSRVKGVQPRWERNKQVYLEDDALLVALAERKDPPEREQETWLTVSAL